MPQLLTDLEVTEISLVGTPANSDARILFAKAASGGLSDAELQQRRDAIAARWSGHSKATGTTNLLNRHKPANTQSPAGHAQQMQNDAGYAALNSSVIPESRGSVYGPLVGGGLGALVSGGSTALLAGAPNLASRYAAAKTGLFHAAGRAAGNAFGRGLGAVADQASRGVFGLTSRGGSLGGRIGGALGTGFSMAGRKAFDFANGAAARAAGSKWGGAALLGVGAAGLGAQFGAQIGSQAGNLYDSIAYRTVQR